MCREQAAIVVGTHSRRPAHNRSTCKQSVFAIYGNEAQVGHSLHDAGNHNVMPHSLYTYAVAVVNTP